jgi:restriction system protein
MVEADADSMCAKYADLARRRVNTSNPPYLHPEDFGYDFRQWVSPYTKTANASGSVAIILQDWASADGLSGSFKPDIQRYGRTPKLLTNKRLDAVLERVLGLSISEVYVTNAFPFIKPGGMSAGIPIRDMVNSITEFTAAELRLARPTMTIALGSLTHRALQRAGLDAIHLPHPAARGMSLDAYEETWRSALNM